MGNHKKAASCTALPSFHSTFTPLSNKSTVPDEHSTFLLADKLAEVSLQKNNRPHRSQSFYLTSNNQFPLPSFCLYSRAALSDEYASDSDIIQFISPQSKTMEERLPMFVGVLHSLFVAVNDLPFDSDSDTENDEDDIKGERLKLRSRENSCEEDIAEKASSFTDEGEEEEDDEDDEGDVDTIHEEKAWMKGEKDDTNLFTIIGLNTMKIITCNLAENDIYKELALAIMVPAHFSDSTITYYTKMLYHSIHNANLLSSTSAAKDIGEQIAPMIHYWFSQFHGDKIITKKNLK